MPPSSAVMRGAETGEGGEVKEETEIGVYAGKLAKDYRLSSENNTHMVLSFATCCALIRRLLRYRFKR